jgi:hypothetical protein
MVWEDEWAQVVGREECNNSVLRTTQALVRIGKLESEPAQGRVSWGKKKREKRDWKAVQVRRKQYDIN